MKENEHQVRVEYEGYTGIARARRVGEEALKWQISVHAANGREIAYWDGPDIEGDGVMMPSIEDIEKAQHEINQAINQYLWDPMSQS